MGNLLATGDNSCAVRLWAMPKTAEQIAAEKAKKAAMLLLELPDADAGSLDEGSAEGSIARKSAPGSASCSAPGNCNDHAVAARRAGAGGSNADGAHYNAHGAAALAGTGDDRSLQTGDDRCLATGDDRCLARSLPKGAAPGGVRGGEGAAPLAKTRTWRSSQQLHAHKSPVTALLFVAEGELGPKPVLFTAAGDWKVVHWEPDDDGKWHIISQLPVSHAAWIMDLCYVSKTVCALSETRGPLLVTAAGDKSLKVSQVSHV